MPVSQLLIDSAANTASLDLLVGGMVQTVYSYAPSGYFTLSMRDDDVAVNRDEQRNLNDVIDAWLVHVLVHCSAWVQMQDYPFKENVEDTGTVRKYELRMGPDNTKAIRASWDRTGAVCVYEKRSVLVLGLKPFQRFVAMLRRIDLEMMVA